MGASDVPGGFMLYMFGAIGGAVLGGIMASKAQDQAANFTAALQPYDVQVGTLFGDSLKSEFERRGVNVSFIDVPPRSEDGKTLDYSGVSVAEQAIVEPILTVAGYRLVSGRLRPILATRVRVLDGGTKQEKFLELFLYGDRLNDNFVTIAPNPDEQFPDTEALFANGERAANALREGTTALAGRVAATIK